MQHCGAGAGFRTALAPALFTREQLPPRAAHSPSHAFNELFYLQRVTASSRGMRVARQSGPAAALLRRITLGIHRGLNVQNYLVRLN